ncbi:thymidine kinase 2, mitochondrial-like [Mercenaria mercenaria]|uniref:thymidine kinase 2, mitochondrial-like n=1 Tax=Mercenaria mercenaria TaxID=6596 RepID=UPI00234F51B5|nr:thymidine kinase 2, mitochondrial-like [Mercenaria mercenaria]
MLTGFVCLFRRGSRVIKGLPVRHLRVSANSFDPPVLGSIMKHSFTVCVEGNIASGKTRLLEYFKKFSPIVEVLEEPTNKWRNIQGHNALAKMYEDPARWGAIFQSYSQLTMTDLHTRPHTCPVKMMERSLHSGRYCFIENLHRNEVMPDLDYVVLTEWFEWLTKSHDIKVDLIVYLRTRPEVVLERVKARLRPEEQCIPLKYLEDLHNLHEEWLINKTTFQPPAPVLVLDANQDIPSMYQVFEEEKAKILFGLATS